MLLNCGDKVLAVHRRLFEGDQSRYYLGEIVAYENGIAKVEGYSWTMEKMHCRIMRKSGLSTKLLALASGTLIVYQLPDGVDPATVEFSTQGSQILLVHGEDTILDLTEAAAEAVTDQLSPH